VTVDEAQAFPALDAGDIAAIEALGTRRAVAAGEYLFRQGDVTYDFYVVISGEVEIVVTSDGADHLVVRHGPGRFVGELSLLSGSRVLVSARVVQAGEVVVLPRDRLRHLIATSPRLGDMILAAFIARRGALQSSAATAIRVIGSRFSPDMLRIREFLARSRIPHEWLDPDRDAGVEVALREFGVTPGELPVVIATGSVLRGPTPGTLAAYLGLTVESLPERRFDLVVVGGGPAGLAAAVYGASEGLRTLGVDTVAFGGQAGSSSRIENYLGFPTGISGGDLTERAVVQAEKFGAQLTSPCTAVSLREEGGHLVVRLSDGTDLLGRAVIAATGAHYRRLDAPRIEEFEGNGVYYAATEMEARLCSGSPVVVAGGGNSAGQAAVFLAGADCPVTVVIRGPDLARSMSRYLVDRILEDARIEVRASTTITAVDGERTLASIQVRGPDGDRLLPCAGLFSFIGADAGSGWLAGCAALDDAGFVLTDRSLTESDLDERWGVLDRGRLPFETSYPGLFAVGDLRSGSIKRVATAVGEGSAAVRSVHEYLAFSH
jgi:thioredoxin reductase (NADPH)